MGEPMQAGQEMDCLIAARVMGYTVRKVKPEWYPVEVTLFFEPGSPLVLYSYDSRSCNAMMRRNGVDEKDGTAQCLPSYSDDIAAAWEVVEKMDSLGWYLTLDRLHQKEAGRFWRCEWMKYTEEDERCGDCWEDGDTPALAICRAALQALASVPPAPAGTEEGA